MAMQRGRKVLLAQAQQDLPSLLKRLVLQLTQKQQRSGTAKQGQEMHRPCLKKESKRMNFSLMGMRSGNQILRMKPSQSVFPILRTPHKQHCRVQLICK